MRFLRPSAFGMTGLSIFLYHRVLPEVKFNPLQTLVTIKTFEKQLEGIASRYSILSMSETLRRINEKIPFKNHAVLTFDDGYSDNYDIVFPILKKKGIPALFSIVTNYIGSGRPLWDWEVLMLLHQNDAVRLIDIGKEKLKRRFLEYPLTFGYRIIERLKGASLSEIESVIQQLKTGAGEIPRPCATSGFGPRNDICMNWDEIRELHRHGMEIASHSLSHRSLARLPAEEATKEISESKTILEKNAGIKCHYFCFPFGSPSDISDSLRKKTKEAGYCGALLNVQGINDRIPNPFGLKRMIMK